MLPANGQNQHWQPRHLFEPQFGGWFSLQLNAEAQVDSEKDRLKQASKIRKICLEKTKGQWSCFGCSSDGNAKETRAASAIPYHGSD